MHWYLLHTKPRQEKCALQNLEQQGYACYLPTLPAEQLRKGALTVSNEPLFPRYLFIQLGDESSSLSWGPIRSTRGVSRLVCFGNQAARVPAALVAHLQAQELAMQASPAPRFQPGDAVRLEGGPLHGLLGVYQIANGEQRAMVLLELMSRPVLMQMPQASLRKIA